MQTTGDIRKHLQDKLYPLYHPREADQLAALIIEHVFGIPPTAQLLGQEVTASEEVIKKIERIVNRLRQQEPIQYILGYTEFYGRHFKTDPRALIPRPETEELVDFALKGDLTSGNTILDIGTGTGCIAITLALETSCNTIALDVEPGALDLAHENAEALNAQVNFLQADILKAPPEVPELDIIISNPPYVPDSDQPTIDFRVKHFEPSQALFVPDRNPLIFYKRIAELAPSYLKPGGQVFLEIYHIAGPAVQELFRGSHWSQVQIKKDLQGEDRMVNASFKS